MRDYRGYYECVAVCVEDVLIASKDPESIVKCLLEDHKFKLKGAGSIKYYLGCDFFRDSKNVLCFTPRKCVKKTISIFEAAFGHKQSTKAHSSLKKGDYPELNASEFLETEEIQKC